MEAMPPEYSNVLVLAAHADDETIGAFGYLYGRRGALTLAFLTDGAPHARWRPSGFSRREYRSIRRAEARAVWHEVDPGARLWFAPFADQQLAFRLQEAATWLRPLADELRPDLILAPAFEGGHPDHDAANLLACALGRELHTAVSEYALYTAHQGQICRQQFPAEPQWRRRLRPAAAAAKRAALNGYGSQARTLADVSAEHEALRPLPRHDYGRPALSERAVYELWGWPWSAVDMARQFAAYVNGSVTACGF